MHVLGQQDGASAVQGGSDNHGIVGRKPIPLRKFQPGLVNGDRDRQDVDRPAKLMQQWPDLCNFQTVLPSGHIREFIQHLNADATPLIEMCFDAPGFLGIFGDQVQ
jgi:hypothetical protein